MTTRSVDFPDGQTSDTTPTVSGSSWGGISGTLSAQTDLQAALDAKAPLASPALTGNPTAPTPSPGDNDTSIATTAFVTAAVAAAPGGVTSVFGRSGAVVAASSDYTATQVTNTPAGGIAATTVQAAINELDTEKANIASPTFTGTPAAPTASAGTNTTQIATTAFVESEISRLGGGINYISANDGSLIGAWVAFADAAGSSPVDGSGGSPASTFAVSTDSSMVGTSNFLWTKSAANRQGEGFSYDFTIDSAYQSKTFTLSFLYKIASGTYVDGDMTCWIYDRTNGTLIQPSAYSILNVIGSETQKCEFQANSNSTSYRLIVHTSSTSALAYSLRFARISVSPGTSSTGSLKIPTIQKFTSGSGTYTTPDGVKWLRIRAIGGGGGGGAGAAGTAGGTGGTTTFGSLISCVGGTGGNSDQGGVGGAATITAPAVGTAGTGGAGASVMVSGPTQSGPVFGGAGAPGWMGQGGGGGGSSSASATAATFYGAGGGGDGASLANNQRGGGGGGAGGFAEAIISSPSATYSYTIGAAGTAGGTLGGSGYIEVTEHYFNAVPASETDTRLVSAAYYGNSGSRSVDTSNPLRFENKEYDTHNFCTGGSGGFSAAIPVPGEYVFTWTSSVTTGQKEFYVYKNGANYYGSTISVANSPSSGTPLNTYSFRGNFKAGDVVDIRTEASVTQNAASGSRITVTRTAGPAQIAASEKIYLYYSDNGGQALTADVTNATWSTKVKDSHGAWNGTVFTSPRSEVFYFTGALNQTANATNYIKMYVNGVFTALGANDTSYSLKSFRFEYYLNASDTVSFRSNAGVTLGSSSTNHWISITSQG
jgi:hypothetical protein